MYIYTYIIYIYIYIYIYNVYICVNIYIYTHKFTSKCHRLPHPRSGDSQGQETFLVPSANKQTCNYEKSAQTTIPPYKP